MSTDPAEKSSRKHKKSKDAASVSDAPERDADKPRKSKKAKVAADAPAPVDATNEAEQAAPVVKESKHKKRKHEGEAEGAGVQEDAVMEEPKKKKKKRKHKSETVKEGGEEGESAASEVKEEQKKRRKKATTDDEEEEETAAEEKTTRRKERPDDAAKPSNDPLDASPAKAKKEKKKRRKDDAHAATSEVVETDKKSKKKKRKQPSTSGFPDPSEDQSLSEQAQKALHYAFTQFEDPSSWKFNKARQNWLIRNVWSDQAIPDTFIPLVTKYLQGVQGGSRESLVKSCREALEPPQPASTTDTEAAAEAEVAPDGQADPQAKRTVKFAAEEPQASDSQPEHTDETKRQRAEALLAALTSST
ncbi:hypothetical protein L226DRAFT_571264 [Lentinus tigrinus ALCF2SS1-7]|uniref:WKF domain-containing protein n=1 Tax=Lentinus tigrinus ALCF2SS1-6 TaxID=1328759 RepID=A0A5C2SF24_9APHY|nr:hypothetical protein L227DRAFT_609747 [Lentinus tigrinus ALCF2SS1-6]RPD74352.1 hypothetical protein L226DRAFT_571264 [Lentinus tigrinus ALCF2SS1-7]